MRKALVIGVNDYHDAPLASCVNDANTIAGLLSVHGDGKPNFDVRLLTCPSAAMTRPVLREAIEKVFTGDPDTALFYFSGHGHVKNTGGYLYTIDGRRYDEGVSMDEVLTLANQSRARNKVVILDCCHSGAMASPALAGSATAQLSEGLSVLASSRGDETSMEVKGSGVFTSLLAAALRGGAADLGGNITAGSLYAYVDQALGAWDQRPIFKTNVTGLSLLRHVKPRVSPEVMRNLTQHFSTPEADYPLVPAHEFTHPAADQEKVKNFHELQQYYSVGLVEPVGAEFMYFAASESKSCRLTALGHQYWRLVKEGRL